MTSTAGAQRAQPCCRSSSTASPIAPAKRSASPIPWSRRFTTARAALTSVFPAGRLALRAFQQSFALPALRYHRTAIPSPNLFSFNSPLGACETCRGFGRVIDIDLDLVIPDPGKTLADGAIKPWMQPHAASAPPARLSASANEVPDQETLGRTDRQTTAARHRRRRRVQGHSRLVPPAGTEEATACTCACSWRATAPICSVPGLSGQPLETRRAALSHRRQRHRPSQRHERRPTPHAFLQRLETASARWIKSRA